MLLSLLFRSDDGFLLLSLRYGGACSRRNRITYWSWARTAYQAFERAFTLALGPGRAGCRYKAFCKAFPHDLRCELANGKEGSTSTATEGMNVRTLGDLLRSQWRLFLRSAAESRQGLKRLSYILLS